MKRGLGKISLGSSQNINKIHIDIYFREMKDQFPGKFTSPLNEKEIKIVQQIILK